MKLFTFGTALLTGAAATVIALAPVAGAQPNVPCDDPGGAARGAACDASAPDGGPPPIVGEIPPGQDGMPDVAGCTPGRVCEAP
ncbi:hypothetical protein FK535_00320 [Mycolicibacterium sp. 018/SC-01/001]|uniref:hypothetical protein n=1 Tax=Mycolicibacterium sp. 018/SC-01/001 TaxID=2592069 RepID=UPI00117EC437|nr:hypothetical protein [Mycolicibacterium sp. 018/SC-01/001]TRW88770.1 hypothetical protein FK535_00320 [Mycolicibacterium sp. 018/SC-01/001]